MLETLRPYQRRAVDQALRAPAGSRLLQSAPTGTGKSRMQLATLAQLRELHRAVLLTPSEGIIRGMLEQLPGCDIDRRAGRAAVYAAAASYGIWTPVRYRNRLEKGELPTPTHLLIDEAHHSAGTTKIARQLETMAPEATWLGWTATPYRGTYKETRALRDFWGMPREVLTIKDAIGGGYMSLPTPTTIPLLDDCEVRVRNGEYDATSAAEAALEQHTWDRLITEIKSKGACMPVPGLGSELNASWDRPTIISVPSSGAREYLVALAEREGVTMREISGETPSEERAALMRGAAAGRWALVFIQVLSEGVDTHWCRRLIDCRPLCSPVAWMQMVGRITRPVTEGEEPPEYWACCRNGERHAYLLSDVWPAAKVVHAAQRSFGSPASGRGARTALDRGLAGDALRKKQRVPIPLWDGGVAEMVHISQPVERREVIALAMPGAPKPRVYVRQSSRHAWGAWFRGKLDEGGYEGWGKATSGAPVSEKQAAWWRDEGLARGLDPDAEITQAQFPILPALKNSRDSLLPGAQVLRSGTGSIADRVNVAADMLAEQGKELERKRLSQAARKLAPTATPGLWCRISERSCFGAKVRTEVQPGDELALRSGRHSGVQLRLVDEVVGMRDGWLLVTVRRKS